MDSVPLASIPSPDILIYIVPPKILILPFEELNEPIPGRLLPGVEELLFPPAALILSSVATREIVPPVITTLVASMPS